MALNRRLLALLVGCCLSVLFAAGRAHATEDAVISADPYPSTYQPIASEPTVITHVHVLTGTGKRFDDAAISMAGGAIVAIGEHVEIPGGAHVTDGGGRWVTPGLIDVHSHIGNMAVPVVNGRADVNEMTDPNTSGVWAEHGVWAQDPAFARALAGGVTTLQILPGSANLFGGRSSTVKNVPSRSVQGMKFPGAPYGLKMACGENPKTVYGTGQKRAPGTRMGNIAGDRTALIKAVEYKRKWDKYRAERKQGKSVNPPDRDLGLETLSGVLAGEILVHVHCYEADDMVQMLDLAREFGIRIAAFHHATEAYKIADLLAANHVCAAIWADWWGFKMEAYDGIRENLPMVHAAGACAIVHSDSPDGVQRLNLAAAQAAGDGRRAGLVIAPEEVIRWITINPATALGIAGRTGSLVPGKAADVVLWSGDPFSIYSHADQVYIDGAVVYDRADRERQPVSDFELGQPAREGRR